MISVFFRIRAARALLLVWLWVAGTGFSSGAPGDNSGAAGPAPAEKIALTTSDGVALAAWYYRAVEAARPKATVILVHDLGGSHETVEPLARGLQAAGFAVVTPDLRGHGGSTARAGGPPRGAPLDADSLRRPDLLAMAASAGGRIRDQASARGDLETVRRWIKEKSDAGELDVDRLCVVGSGAGGTLGALWVVADASWPPTTSGPQGGGVAALALISPEITTAAGLSIMPALQADVLRRRMPILLVSGTKDSDAAKISDRLKGLRPREWVEQGPGQKRAQADGLAKPTDATIFAMQADSPLSADELAADASAKTSAVIVGFLDLILGR